MKIYAPELYALAKRALDRVKREYGDEKSILINGAWISVEKDFQGTDCAVLYTARSAVYLNHVEQALRVFIGLVDSEKSPCAQVIIMDSPEREWKKQQEELAKVLHTFFKTQEGLSDELAEHYAGVFSTGFFKVQKGTSYGNNHIEDVSEIVRAALNEYDSVTLRVSKEGAGEDWTGHITVEIADAQQRGPDEL